MNYILVIVTVNATKPAHWLDWLENADGIYANPAYLSQMGRDVILGYMFVCFGVLPTSPLPAYWT